MNFSFWGPAYFQGLLLLASSRFSPKTMGCNDQRVFECLKVKSCCCLGWLYIRCGWQTSILGRGMSHFVFLTRHDCWLIQTFKTDHNQQLSHQASSQSTNHLPYGFFCFKVSSVVSATPRSVAFTQRPQLSPGASSWRGELGSSIHPWEVGMIRWWWNVSGGFFSKEKVKVVKEMDVKQFVSPKKMYVCFFQRKDSSENWMVQLGKNKQTEKNPAITHC